MFLTYLLLPIAFVFLIKGADLLVDGASSIAKRFGIPSIVIGLTIVAFGTSAPELIVSVLASVRGSTDIAIANILGSNIANILLILGISAAIFPLAVKKQTTWKEIPFSLLAVLLVALMANDALIDGGSFSGLTRIDGFALLSFFVIFLYYIFGISKAEFADVEEPAIRRYSLSRSWTMVFAGLLGLTIGGKWVVESAVGIASALGASEALIGLTIVAIGTSLPELATSAVAAYKKNADIAVGNVVGSNIFNVFWVLGLSAVIHPLPFSKDLTADALFAVFTAIMLFLVMFIGKRHTIDRGQGIFFIVLYVAYIVYVVLRG